ncbi:outer membrane beta-barrel protein [Pontibacter mangrovi]|uniref:Outer membrane protein beta-barrel domain-containing protein n=1 Tax=Pontibacter mangrovi TaxID=2589816 RepID=A0A501VYE8_9BACT|nr:outer membrane beta-barrel protein [Pontibacter mangrovi]TPE39991.1 hypothetical protein FJM65_20490 [Pontibacter mangrovi]
MKHKLYFILASVILLSLSAVQVQAQRGYKPKFRQSQYRYFKREPKFAVVAGAGLAVMNSDNRSGGLGEKNIIRNNGRGAALNIGALYQLTPRVAVTGTVDFTRFKGYEDDVNTLGHDKSFNAESIGASGSVVVNLINSYGGRGIYRPKNRRLIVPYLKAGIGFINYKSSSFLKATGEKFEPEADYPTIAAVIPVGAGLKFYYSPRLSIAPEFNLNFTTTDHLDNMVDPEGLLGKNDHFITASVKVMYYPKFRGR